MELINAQNVTESKFIECFGYKETGNLGKME